MADSGDARRGRVTGVGDEKEPRAATPPGERMSREAPAFENDGDAGSLGPRISNSGGTVAARPL